MSEFFHSIYAQIMKESLGMTGGLIFFCSWVLQAWESRRAGTSIVSVRFFVLRSIASALLTLEGIRSGSLSVTLVMAATLILMLYNILLQLKQSRNEAAS